MRVSTSMMYQQHSANITQANSNYNDRTTRLASQRSHLLPSDDPFAASQAVKTQHELARNEQYASARDNAIGALGLEDNTLSDIFDAVQTAKTKIIQAGDGGLSNEDRASLALELESLRERLYSLGNTRDSAGNYIFAGTKTDTPPFAENNGVITYQGSDAAISQKVGESRDMAVGHIGSEVFSSGGHDIFASLDNAITALRTPVNTDDEREAMRQVLDGANLTMKAMINQGGRIQSEVGTNLRELDLLESSGAKQQIDLTDKFQKYVGSDSDSVVTMIGQSKMAEVAVQISMSTFQTMQSLSLFNLIR